MRAHSRRNAALAPGTCDRPQASSLPCPAHATARSENARSAVSHYEVVRRLTTRFGLTPFDLESAILTAMREAAYARNIDWNRVLAADADLLNGDHPERHAAVRVVALCAARCAV